MTSKFNVTFYEQQTDLTIDDKEYTLGSDPLEIFIPELVFKPILEDDPETTEDGTELIYEILIEQNGDFVPLSADLGHLNTELLVLTIDSTDVQFLGDQVLRVKWTLQDFLKDKVITTDFNLLVIEEITLIDTISGSLTRSAPVCLSTISS